MRTLELQDGRVIVKFTEAFELVEVCDWNGNDLSSTRWETVALEEIDERKFLEGILDATE